MQVFEATLDVHNISSQPQTPFLPGHMWYMQVAAVSPLLFPFFSVVTVPAVRVPAGWRKRWDEGRLCALSHAWCSAQGGRPSVQEATGPLTPSLLLLCLDTA